MNPQALSRKKTRRSIRENACIHAMLARDFNSHEHAASTCREHSRERPASCARSTGYLSVMAGRKRGFMPSSIPLGLLVMPVGGALAVAMAVVNRPLSAFSAIPGSMTPSAILDLQGLPSARKQAEKGDERGRQHHTWRLGNRRAGAADSGSSVGDQVAS